MINLNEEKKILAKARAVVLAELDRSGTAILPPCDAEKTLTFLLALGIHARVTILDPWYNKGVGGVRSDYIPYIVGILEKTKDVSDHLFLWGFPEILAPFIERIPKPLELICWLTWYFKNNPSVIRGWRSAQMTCLHLANPKAPLNVQNFLNEAQLKMFKEGKLRYIPGPPSVLEESLLIGFIGRNEQTGHPAQKPLRVIEKLLLMGSKEGELIIDPMSGSGTTADAARRLGRFSIICDHSEEFTCLAEKRLGVSRLDISPDVMSLSFPIKCHLNKIEEFRAICGYTFNSKDSTDSHRNINRNSKGQVSLPFTLSDAGNGAYKVPSLKAKRRKGTMAKASV